MQVHPEVIGREAPQALFTNSIFGLAMICFPDACDRTSQLDEWC